MPEIDRVKVEEFIQHIAALLGGGFVRETLLARLCLSGFKLRKAVHLRLPELCTTEGVNVVAEAKIRALCESLDSHYFPRQLRINALIREHVARSGLLETCADGTVILDGPAFPSRKGADAITTRAAQRSLHRAWSTCLSKFPEYRFSDIQRLGKLALTCCAEVCDSRPELHEVLLTIQYSLRGVGFQSTDHRDDAAQEAILRYLEVSSSVRMTNKLFARHISRIVAYEMQRRIRSDRHVFWPNMHLLEGSMCKKALRPNKDVRVKELESGLSALNKAEREVISLRFGLESDEPATLTSTARLLGISRAAASRLERQAIRFLRRWLEASDSQLRRNAS